MNTLDIRFDPDFPPLLQPLVFGLVERWAPYFTATVTRLYIKVSDLDGGGCQVLPRLEYRDATLWISGNWLTLPPNEQEEYIVHELAHLLTEPLRHFARKMARRYADAELLEQLLEDVNECAEGVTEDVYRAVWHAKCDRALTLTQKPLKVPSVGGHNEVPERTKKRIDQPPSHEE